MKTYKTVLSIAGSDSGGGAGIQADLKTMTSLNCYGLSVITSLTAQNTRGVQGIHPVPVNFIKAQLESVFNDIEIHAIKIGMLHNKEVVAMLAGFLKDFSNIPIVLDPVMVATSGDLLLKEDAISAIITKIFPLTTLITPNFHEAQVLSKSVLKGEKDIKAALKVLNKMGAENVLIKGGDIKSELARDLLYLGSSNEVLVFENQKIKTHNLHGTGCTLSSAIASYLAKGYSVKDAVELSKKYINSAIYSGAGFKLGNGNGPVNHMWANSENK